jgi:hypothetical protein
MWSASYKLGTPSRPGTMKKIDVAIETINK